MNHYELLAIISGKYAEPEAIIVLHTLEEIIKKHASAFHYSQNLERKKLAYPIQHHSYGTYVLVEFDTDPGTLKTIDHEVRHTNEIIRYTIVKRDTVGAPKKLEKPISAQPIVSPRAHTGTPDYIPTSPAPVMQAPLQEQPPVVPQQTQEEKKEKTVSVEDLDAVLAVPAEEPKTEPDDTKKKQKKVTYEELDKKLDEILNNTIL